MDISPEAHIRMQAAFQKSVDNAVSKTVNFQNSATKEDIEKVYRLAYKLNCKGVTVYRDGSRNVQVLNIGKKDKKSAETVDDHMATRAPRVRPRTTAGATMKMRTGCGNMYVTINEDNHGICEVFTQLGKSGGCTMSQSEAVGRLVSLSLRSGISPEQIIDQLRGIRCPSPTFQEGEAVLSCPDALAKSLDIYLKEKTTPNLFNAQNPQQQQQQSSAEPVNAKTYVAKPSSPRNNGNTEGLCKECPDCGNILEMGEGCMSCRICGYSRCS